MRIAVAQQSMSLVLMVVFAITSARWLGPSGKGMLTIVTTAGFVGGSVLGLGIPQALAAWVSSDRLGVGDALKVGAGFATLVVIAAWCLTRPSIFSSALSMNLLWLSMGVVLLAGTHH